MEIYLLSSDDTLTSEALKHQLEVLPEWDSSITLEIRQEKREALRALDPTVVAAVFTMVGTGVGALITGLLQVAQANYKEKIVLVSRNGLRIEIEARHAQSKIPELIKLVNAMEVDVMKI